MYANANRRLAKRRACLGVETSPADPWSRLQPKVARFQGGGACSSGQNTRTAQTENGPTLIFHLLIVLPLLISPLLLTTRHLNVEPALDSLLRPSTRTLRLPPTVNMREIVRVRILLCFLRVLSPASTHRLPYIKSSAHLLTVLCTGSPSDWPMCKRVLTVLLSHEGPLT